MDNKISIAVYKVIKENVLIMKLTKQVEIINDVGLITPFICVILCVHMSLKTKQKT